MRGLHIRARGLLVGVATVAVGLPFVATGTAVAAANASGGGFDAAGNVLITDQFNNRVIEVNPVTKAIVWSFGSGNPSLCNPGPGAIVGLNDAERLSDGLTLLAGTGVPLGLSPADPTFSCVDNRVIIVNEAGTIVWQYGQAGVTGSGPNQLNVPVFAIQLPNRNIMIVDQGNNRVIEVGFSSKTVVWSYGPTSGPGALNNPNSAELLRNGHVLIADENNNRAIEITRSGRIVWQYGSGNPSVTSPVQFVAFASRLPNGDTLITDSGHSRIVEVTEDKHVVFHYFTNTASGSAASPLPTNAVQLENGDISIADQFNHRAIIIDHGGRLLEQIGETGVPGLGFDQLDGPYTAFVIGDYTGQTPPPDI
jgi:hypothetical protein